MNKIMYRVIALVCFALLLVGCKESPIKLVKTGVLESYPSVAIGDALESSFTDGKWTTFKTKKQKTIVEFQGKVGKDLDKRYFDEKISISSKTEKEKYNLKNMNDVLVLGKYISSCDTKGIVRGYDFDYDAPVEYLTVILFNTCTEERPNSFKSEGKYASSILLSAAVAYRNKYYIAEGQPTKIQFTIDKDGQNFNITYFKIEGSELEYKSLADWIFN